MSNNFKKGLSLIDVFCIATGAMISSGIFVLPGLAHAKAGPGVIFSYLFAGLLALPGMLSILEMTTAMPKAGGDCFSMLIGSKDERNFHLRALSAIAQIVQDANFEKNWMSARDEQVLKDILLLTNRKR